MCLDEFISAAYLVYCAKYTCFAQANVSHSTEYHGSQRLWVHLYKPLENGVLSLKLAFVK